MLLRRKKYLSIIFILIIILGSIYFINKIQANPNHEESIIQFGTKRAKFINQKWVYHRKELKKHNKMTKKEIQNRIESIIFWAKEFNDMYPDINSYRVVLDMLVIPEIETGWVNWNSHINEKGKRYGTLDNGNSFGIWSIEWETAYWIAQKNDWQLKGRNDEIKLISDTHKQTKFAVWYYYYQLQDKNGDRLSALMGYNMPSIDHKQERWRNYGMNLWGRIHYHETLLKKYNFLTIEDDINNEIFISQRN
ncbi:MAG: hypothetical protein ACQEQF_04950 [Bacillota bacterium]